MKITRYLMLILLCLGHSICAKNKAKNSHADLDPYVLLKQVYKDIDDNGPLSQDKEKKYAKQLRILAARSIRKNEEISSALYDVHYKLLQNIRKEFSSLSDEEYRKYNSMGVILFEKNEHPNNVITVLLREARSLSITALDKLISLYRNTLYESFKYDSRILSFFKETALEGFPKSQFFYGTYLLHGIGVEQNISEGLKYLRLAAQGGLSNASIALADYYNYKKDAKNAKKYLQLGVVQKSTEAMYTLGISEHENGNYDEAFSLCSKALTMDPACHGAKLILGKMYFSGEGVVQDMEKGCLLMREAAEKIDATSPLWLQCLSCSTLGSLYENGIGVEKSLPKAAEYFNKIKTLEAKFVYQL